jgi:flagellar biosynthesis protein FlhF
LTFVDKVKRGAPLFWLLDEDIPPVSYFSTGERVPEDLIKVDPQDLVNLLLRGLNKI